ncbi:MAG: hypothetical protein ACK4M2_01295 [Brevundimonas sp.]
MLVRAPELDDTIDVLKRWTAHLHQAEVIHGAWLFGSAINKQGMGFDRTSDVDVLLRVDWDDLEPDARIDALEAIAREKLALEVQLMQILKRESAGQPISSVVPMTQFEIDNAIHKDGNNLIITTARVLDLLTGDEATALNPAADESMLEQAHRKALEWVQKKRASHLARSANGAGGLGSVHPNESEAAPKDLLRQFAIASLDASDPDRTDTNKGLQELNGYLATVDPTGPRGGLFREWLTVGGGGRGSRAPMPIEYYLFGVEGVFDRIRDQYQTKPVISLTRAARALPSSTQRQPPLSAVFTVSTRDTLSGGAKAIERTITDARSNLKFGHQPGFQVVFEEEADVEALLAGDGANLSSADFQRRQRAFDRRSKVALLTTQVERGLRHLLYGGGLLFISEGSKIPRLLRLSADAFVKHTLAHGSGNPGGMWAARHADLYPDTPVSSFLFRAGDVSLEAVGALAPVADIPAVERTASFVPELLAAVHRRELALGRELDDQELQGFLHLNLWEFGYH